MDKGKSKIKQIYYSNWSEELGEGHEDYYQMMSTIARWIGNSIEGCKRIPRQKTQWASTIGVSQTKEKFGEPRVYCSFAMEAAVRKEYKKLTKSIKKQNTLYHKWVKTKKCRPQMKKEYESGKYPMLIPDLNEFTNECYFKDLKYYRNVYFDAFKLWPQYEEAIRNGADLYEYLFETEEELDIYYDNLIDKQLASLKASKQWTKAVEISVISRLRDRKEKIKNTYTFLNTIGDKDAKERIG